METEKNKVSRPYLYTPKGRPNVFLVSWIDPRNQKRTTNSLKTKIELDAKQITLDMEELINTPAWWGLAPEAPELDHLNDRAVEIFFGRPRETRATSYEIAIHPSGGKARRAYATKHRMERKIQRLEIDAKAVDEERTRRIEAERKLVELERDGKEKDQELKKLRRKLNLHCSELLKDAVKKFSAWYPEGHSPSDSKQVIAMAESFRDFYGGEKHLANVTAQDVNEWIAGLKRRFDQDADHSDATQKKLAEPLGSQTRAKYKRYLSVFMTWAFKSYDLSENPITKTLAISGVERHPENIVAIRRYEQLEALLDGLEDWPYWQAWVAVAILAGPRWSEQKWLKVDDVYLESGYLRITSRAGGKRLKGTKTGRERNVPIENTKLKAILEKYLATHPGNTPWLFPRVTEVVTDKKPVYHLTESQWSHGKNFLEMWRPLSAIAKEKSKLKGDFWAYGPREWRHCAATAMGHSGCNEVQVSQWSGNTPDMVRRHYMSPVSAKLWPLRWD